MWRRGLQESRQGGNASSVSSPVPRSRLTVASPVQAAHPWLGTAAPALSPATHPRQALPAAPGAESDRHIADSVESRSKSGKRWWIVGIVGGGLFAAVMAVLTMGVWWPQRDLEE